MADLSNTESAEVTVAGEDGINRLKVNSNGSINVTNVLAATPTAATAVNVSAFSSVSSTAGVDTYYTITNTKVLTIQTFLAGSEETTGGGVVSLFYDPNGDLSVLTRISTLFVNGTSDDAPVGQTFTGNGTRRIVLRRRGYTTSGREMFGQWIGYEE